MILRVYAHEELMKNKLVSLCPRELQNSQCSILSAFIKSYQAFFNVHGSVHRKNILIYIQQDAALHSLSGN